MRSRRVQCLCLLALVLGFGATSVARAEETGWVVASGGIFNVGSHADATDDGKEGILGIEWRGRPHLLGLQPNLGLAVHTAAGGYVFGGLRRDFSLSRSWGISLGFGVSLFENGDGIDLGGLVEFRSSFEIFANVGEASRIGIDYYHLSNARLYDTNPGANSLVLFYGHRIR